MTEAEQERAAVVEYARHLAQINHRIAAENAGLRTEHIALSSAYSTIADAIERGDHLGEKRG